MTAKIKYVSVMVIVIIVIISLMSYTILDKPKYDYTFYYCVEIENTGSPQNSTVIVPMPDFQENKSYWSNLLLNNSVRAGEMDVKVIESTFGNALIINSTGGCRFQFITNASVPASTLTMLNNSLMPNNTINNFYAYYDNSSMLLSLDIYMHNYEHNTKQGNAYAIHVSPSPVGWFEQEGYIYEGHFGI